MRPADKEQNRIAPEGLAPRMVDIDAVAAYLGVTVRHVRRLVNERRIPFYKWSRLLRFDPAEIAAWVEETRVDPDRPLGPGRVPTRLSPYPSQRPA